MASDSAMRGVSRRRPGIYRSNLPSYREVNALGRTYRVRLSRREGDSIKIEDAPQIALPAIGPYRSVPKLRRNTQTVPKIEATNIPKKAEERAEGMRIFSFNSVAIPLGGVSSFFSVFLFRLIANASKLRGRYREMKALAKVVRNLFEAA